MSAPHPILKLTSYQEQILTGLMLGDGYLHQNSKNCYLRVARQYQDLQYLHYEAQVFGNLLLPSHQSSFGKSYFLYDKRQNKLSVECYFATQTNPIFTHYHQIWYHKNKKIIPTNLTLSAITMAHWIADDGYFEFHHGNHNRYILTFATHGFKKKEVKFLISLLQSRYQAQFLLKRKRRYHKYYYIIVAYDTATRKVIQDIDPYFKLTRKRIWDQANNIYTNIPLPQEARKKKFQWRQKQLIFFANSHRGKTILIARLFHLCQFHGKIYFNRIKNILDKNKINYLKFKHNNQHFIRFI